MTELALEIRQDMTGVASGETEMARDSLVNRITGGPDCQAGSNMANQTACYGEGWLGAGSWYMTIARNNAHISTLMTAQATASEGSYISEFESGSEYRADLVSSAGTGGWIVTRGDYSNLLEPEAALRHWNGFMSGFESDTEVLATLGFTLPPAETIVAANASDEDANRAIDRFSADWQERIVGTFASWGGLGAGDPMVNLIDLGQILISISSALIAIFILPFIDAAAVSTLITTTWGAGALLAFILPMMPFILWVIAVTGYFLLVIEAVVAVSLWAFAHLRMDGDGISGAATAGWTMLLSLILTPVLMVFGFIVGMTIFRVTAGLLLGGLFPAVTGILGGSGAWIFLLMLPAVAIMVAIMMMILIERSFSLVSEFPNRVLAWIGGRTDLADQGALDRTRAGMIGGAAAMGTAGSMAGRGANAFGKWGAGQLKNKGGDAGEGGKGPNSKTSTSD